MPTGDADRALSLLRSAAERVTTIEADLAATRLQLASAEAELAVLREKSADAKRLYTIPEAATALGLGRSTMFEVVKGGAIPTVSIGARRFVTADDLDAYIDGLRNAS